VHTGATGVHKDLKEIQEQQELAGATGPKGHTGATGPKGDTGAYRTNRCQQVQRPIQEQQDRKGDTGLTGPTGATGQQADRCNRS
jgi:hypothetical protein